LKNEENSTIISAMKRNEIPIGRAAEEIAQQAGQAMRNEDPFTRMVTRRVFTGNVIVLGDIGEMIKDPKMDDLPNPAIGPLSSDYVERAAPELTRFGKAAFALLAPLSRFGITGRLPEEFSVEPELAENIRSKNRKNVKRRATIIGPEGPVKRKR
jgi:hypothetical protein